MNKLSKRLLTVASFIDDGSSVIDVGCDHGLLSIYLVNNKNNIKVIASDVNENALSSARDNVKKYGLEDKISVRLGNGLDVISKDEVDTVIISGMGSNTIVDILKSSTDKLDNINNIVIQSNTDLYFLRYNIIKLGYFICDEEIIQDKNIIYTIIKFSKGDRKYNYKQLYLGPILMNKKSSLYIEKCKKDINTLNNILASIKKGHFIYKIKIKRDIRYLENIIKE